MPYYPYPPYLYQPQQQQMQNNGFLSVPSEDIVNTYPVAPGNCVTFKIEGKPIVMEKSMGFSQLESPRVERYRLVKETADLPRAEEKRDETVKLSQKDFRAEFDQIWAEIEALKKDIRPKKKKEVENDTEL